MNIPKETRRQSHAAVHPHKAARQAAIMAILNECGGMTAQEVAAELHRRGFVSSDERNFAAPRLTELKEAGRIAATGKTTCTKTGRTVTVWSAGKE